MSIHLHEPNSSFKHDGGPWLMLSGGGYVLVVKADTRYKTMVEGERGIPLSFPFQNRTKSISFSMYLGISNTLLSRPHAQTGQNNRRIIMYGATLGADFFP